MVIDNKVVHFLVQSSIVGLEILELVAVTKAVVLKLLKVASSPITKVEETEVNGSKLTKEVSMVP